MIADLDTTKSREILTRLATKTLVPQTRFYTAIDLLDEMCIRDRSKDDTQAAVGELKAEFFSALGTEHPELYRQLVAALELSLIHICIQ